MVLLLLLFVSFLVSTAISAPAYAKDDGVRVPVVVAFARLHPNRHHTAVQPAGRVLFLHPEHDDATGLVVYVSAHALDPYQKYTYHIHENPVMDGVCESAGAHLDPFHVNTPNTTYHCNPQQPQLTCELGDLAGKHGPLVSDRYGQARKRMHEECLDWIGEEGVVGRSVVLHDANNTRIACGNIHAVWQHFV